MHEKNIPPTNYPSVISCEVDDSEYLSVSFIGANVSTGSYVGGIICNWQKMN